MKAAALALLLLSVTAAADPAPATPDDAPVIYKVKKGTALIEDEKGAEQSVILPEGMFVNIAGALKLQRYTDALDMQLQDVKAQNDVLRANVDQLIAEPPIPVRTIILVAVGALVVGAAAGAGAMLLRK